MDQGKAEPDFETDERVTRIISLVMRQYNGLLGAFAADPTSFEPLFLRCTT